MTQKPYVRKKWPTWIKAALIKAWFYGAVYFFIGWGLLFSTADQLDLIAALGLVMGALNDLAVNRIFRGLETDRLEYHPYMLFPGKSVGSFCMNLLYGLFLSAFVAYLYHFFNVAVIQICKLPETAVPLGAEPVGYGAICMLLDLLFARIRYAIQRKKEAQKNHAVP